MFTVLNSSGYLSGHSTASLSSCFACSNPPISSHLTLGTSTSTSLIAEGSMFFNASKKSSIVTFRFSRTSSGISSASMSISGRTLLNACIAASLHKAARSAPTNPTVKSASTSKSTSSARGILLVWISSISFLPSLSGTPISISLSNLPGLLKAGSIASGLFVAPMTITSPLASNPSISVSS